MALLSHSLITLEYAKAMMRITKADATRDAALVNVINSVTEDIETFLNGRRLAEATHTIFMDGSGFNEQYLPHYPITGETTLYIDSNRGFGDSYLIGTSGYEVYGEDGYLKLVGSSTHRGLFPRGTKNVKVIFTAGWAAIPANVQLAAAMAVEHEWAQMYDQKRMNIIQVGQGAGGGSVTYKIEKGMLPTAVMAKLRPYRLPVGLVTPWTYTAPT